MLLDRRSLIHFPASIVAGQSNRYNTQIMRTSLDYRPVVVCNPASTHYERVGPEVISPLSEDSAWGVPEVWETPGKDALENAEFLAGKVKPGDMIIGLRW